MSQSLKQQRVAIVHDWLIGGGAELVIEELHRLFPDAPIYTSYCSNEWRKRLNNKVVTGWPQYLGKFRKYIPVLRIIWFTRLRFDDFDLVISSSGAEAKGIRVPVGVKHINYCHAPTHYYWSRYDEYMQHPGFGAFDWLARIGLRLLVGPLRKWDYKAAQRPDAMIANSTHTQAAIKKYYGRNSVVIFPPVSIERFQKPELQSLPRSGFIISGRQVPYKRFDRAIQACNNLQLPLRIIGDGPDNKRLRELAGPTITFLGKLTDIELEREFASAEAFIFPGIDDFGIVAVEALAAGTPVVAFKAGGALDYIAPNATGLFFEESTIESLSSALVTFTEHTWDYRKIQSSAQSYSRRVFVNKITQVLNSSDA